MLKASFQCCDIRKVKPGILTFFFSDLESSFQNNTKQSF